MFKKLIDISKNLRVKILETAMKNGGKGSHIGGTFSCIEILVFLYFGRILKFKSEKPKWKGRDRLLIGKGHAHLALYHIWHDLGFIGKKLLESYGKNGSKLGQQLNINTPGSEYNTGSLGHVLGIGTGISYSAKLDGKKFTTYVLLGDAECDEGAIWEAAMFAGKYKLNNLVAIIDKNNLSVMERIKESKDLNLSSRFKSCGWETLKVDGHSFQNLKKTFKKISYKKPTVIIAETIKGKGISFMENEIFWHSGIATKEQFNKAISEIKG